MIQLFDTTLRDGAQGYGISFSVQDKLRIIKLLDELGIDIIEAGNPAASISDAELLSKSIPLSHARLAAFGSTRHKDNIASLDPSLNALASTAAPIAVIFGKCSKSDCINVIRTTPEENLNMIFQSVEYLVQKGKTVIFDAEHFFTSYKEDADYAIKALLAAQDAGAQSVCLCDTCGGTLPGEVSKVVSRICSLLSIPVSIHAHDDSGLATAVSLAAVEAGASGVQGTLNGIGERCGNANLSSIIPNLILKMNRRCLINGDLSSLTRTCRSVSEICNILLPRSLPFVGKNAFAHKAGMHVDAISKQKGAYEHIDPDAVGNQRKILLSEYSGRVSVSKKLEDLNPELAGDEELARSLTATVKRMEHQGYRFEGADASFELLALRTKGLLKDYFTLDVFKLIDQQSSPETPTTAMAMVRVSVSGQSVTDTAEGRGPIDVLDRALIKALSVFYPAAASIQLTDFKVRFLDTTPTAGTSVRVMIERTDGVNFWSTTGASTDIVEASAIALVDSIIYKLYKDEKSKM